MRSSPLYPYFQFCNLQPGCEDHLILTHSLIANCCNQLSVLQIGGPFQQLIFKVARFLQFCFQYFESTPHLEFWGFQSEWYKRFSQHRIGLQVLDLPGVSYTPQDFLSAPLHVLHILLVILYGFSLGLPSLPRVRLSCSPCSWKSPNSVFACSYSFLQDPWLCSSILPVLWFVLFHLSLILKVQGLFILILHCTLALKLSLTPQVCPAIPMHVLPYHTSPFPNVPPVSLWGLNRAN